MNHITKVLEDFDRLDVPELWAEDSYKVLKQFITNAHTTYLESEKEKLVKLASSEHVDNYGLAHAQGVNCERIKQISHIDTQLKEINDK